jgi:hypothetical protein
MSTNFIQRRRFTIWGVASGTVILIFAYFNLDLVQLGNWFVNELQPHRIDDFVAAIALAVVGISIDNRRDKKHDRLKLQIQADRLAVLKATMRTVQDLVNNFLNNMQLVQLEAGDALSQETLELLERITFETSSKLKALGDLGYVPETQMAIGAGIST